MQRKKARQVVFAAANPDPARHLAIAGTKLAVSEWELGQLGVVEGVAAAGPHLGDAAARIAEEWRKAVRGVFGSGRNPKHVVLARRQAVILAAGMRQDNALEPRAEKIIGGVVEVVLERAEAHGRLDRRGL